MAFHWGFLWWRLLVCNTGSTSILVLSEDAKCCGGLLVPKRSPGFRLLIYGADLISSPHDGDP